jgi:hypothetical protein
MFDQQGRPYPNYAGRMKYKIQSFTSWRKEARRILCTTVYGQPARRAYDMGRKLSNGFMGLLKVGMA